MNLRTRLRSERGATLLIIIGIAAALAVMTATLVFVVGNMQANTADSRTREKAATVGEAAMDGQMYALAVNWPKACAEPRTDAGYPRLRAQFSPAEFPNTTGNFVGAVYYDDSDTNGDGQSSTSPTLTGIANGNRRMYIEAQGKVNGRATRFQALVERRFVDTTFPHGIAVYDGGAMDSNGGGNNPKITVYNDGGYPVSGYVNGTIAAPDVFDTSAIAVVSPTVPPLSDLIPDSLLQQVIAMAQNTTGGSNSGSQYYDCTSGNPVQMPGNAGMQGICVIRVNDGTTVNLSGGINMADGPYAVPAATDQPGILMILGPEPEPAGTNTGPLIKIDIGGNDKFYGVLYTNGQLNFAHGTPSFFGMTSSRLHRTCAARPTSSYDDSAITKLFTK